MIKDLLTELKHKGTVQKVEAEKKYPGTVKHWTNMKYWVRKTKAFL